MNILDLSSQDFEDFKTEALELLDIAERSLLELDKEPLRFEANYDAIFRSLHNLKGSSGMMELNELRDHTHEIETIFNTFKGKDYIPQSYVSFFLKGVDAARSILNGDKISFNYNIDNETKTTIELPVKSTVEPSVISQFSVEEYITSAKEYVESINKNLAVIEKGEVTKEVLDTVYREIHSLKGDSYLFNFGAIGDVAHAMESALEPLRSQSLSVDTNLINCLYKALDVIELLLNTKLEDHHQSSISRIVQTMSIALEKASGRCLIKNSPKEEVTHPLKVKKENKETEAVSSVRVSVNLLDTLLNLVGEMVLIRNQVLQYSNVNEDYELKSLSKRLNVVTTEIQEHMMKTRMQSMSVILGKFGRVVRDLSSDLGKKIELKIEGAETELDKSLLEAIKDPLTHIVRNACDHGIETPEERLRKGKPEVGQISIKSFHESGQVFVEINDDGKGLSKEKIIEKALEKNLISQADASRLSPKEIFDLIFLPGFSTASAITSVSGRGVGMDVVRTNIERVGGSIDLYSEENVGTKIRMRIPLTLAIIPALMVRCSDNIFCIPQLKLEELVRVDLSENPHLIESLYGSSIYRLRGNILQLVDLNKALGQKSHKDQNVVNIAVLNADNFLFGLIVDEVLDTADIVVKPLTHALKSLNLYTGATILGDGSVALILDVPGIAKNAQLNTDIKNKHLEEIDSYTEVQDFLFFSLQSKTHHAMSLTYVERIEVFPSVQIEFSGLQPSIRYRDDVLPLIDVSEQLGYGKGSIGEFVNIVVIKRAGKYLGLLVNQILDTLSTTIEVKPTVRPVQGIVGNLNTPEGLVVIVDPFQIVDKHLGIVHDFSKTVSYQTDNKVVLLVEDTVFFKRLIQGVLEKSGYKVLSAINGAEAIDVLNKHHVDVIVSDIEMPKMNGFEMARVIRQYPQYKNLPMIAVSSKADKTYRDEGMKAGFDMYFEKLNPEILLSALSELGRGERKSA